MSAINETSTVRSQYADAGNLNTRISIHEKYSTNKESFGDWIVSNYEINRGMRVLELGCGTGNMWLEHKDQIERCELLVLSDFSEGMLGQAKETLRGYEGIEYRVIDIQNIPYEDNTFDIVIANMMLYHVPNLHKALGEVHRVLKVDGTFYCATYGEHGITEYLADVLGVYGVENNINRNFTLQNGAEILSREFSCVTMLTREDSLAVTDVNDMADYIYSLAGMSALSSVPRAKVVKLLEERMKDGILHVPKEYGMFVCENT